MHWHWVVIYEHNVLVCKISLKFIQRVNLWGFCQSVLCDVVFVQCLYLKLAGLHSCSRVDGWSVSCSRCQSVAVLWWDNGHAPGKLGCMYECMYCQRCSPRGQTLASGPQGQTLALALSKMNENVRSTVYLNFCTACALKSLGLEGWGLG